MGKKPSRHQNQRANIVLGEFIGSGSHAILYTIHTDQKEKRIEQTTQLKKMYPTLAYEGRISL